MHGLTHGLRFQLVNEAAQFRELFLPADKAIRRRHARRPRAGSRAAGAAAPLASARTGTGRARAIVSAAERAATGRDDQRRTEDARAMNRDRHD